MSDIKIQPSGSGTAVVTLTAPATNTARTITLPDSTSTLLASDGSGASLTGILTGITDNSNATAITIDSSENITTTGNLVIASAKVLTLGSMELNTNRLSIGNTGRIDMGSSTIGIAGDGSSGIKVSAGGTERMRFESGGNIKVQTGNLYFGTAGKGIVLGSTSGNVTNLLDDYEEGTWTPVATCASGSFGSDPGNYGYYTKVGNLVFINGVIPNIPLSSASGAITITGLPFTSKTVSGSQTRHGFQLSSRQEYYTTEDNQPIFQVRSNSTTIDVINADGTWHSATEVSDLTNYWYPMFSGYYLV